MKRQNYFFIPLLLSMSFYALTTSAQVLYGHSENINCITSGEKFTVLENYYVAGDSLLTYYGDGSFSIDTPTSISTFTTTVATYSHTHFYTTSGSYTVKHVLKSGGLRIDSLQFSNPFAYCADMTILGFFDNNANCTFDPGDNLLYTPAKIQVDSAGIAIDTIYVLSGYTYRGSGPIGTIYRFTLLTPPSGAVVSCPASGIIADTIPAVAYKIKDKSISFQCSSSSSFDISEFPAAIAGKHAFIAEIVNNAYNCLATPATLTMSCSPKYHFREAFPPETSVSGNTVTWDLSTVGVFEMHDIHVHFEAPNPFTAPLPPGDTIHSSYTLTPISGDTNPTDNTFNRIDTVRYSFDPNVKSVSPEGKIKAGTPLQYTIQFENTGNDTAHNIHIMDTLSDNLDLQTFHIVSASAKVVLSFHQASGHNVVKFDFPDINLLDSSHHGQCDGIVLYSINAKNSLPYGTVIDNRAGIYFDDNDVVMTNTAENIIGTPVSTPPVCTGSVSPVIFPNPAHSEVRISADNTMYNSLSVTNAIGQTLISQHLDTQVTTLNIAELPAGVYFVTVRGQGGVTVQKLEKY